MLRSSSTLRNSLCKYLVLCILFYFFFFHTFDNVDYFYANILGQKREGKCIINIMAVVKNICHYRLVAEHCVAG